MTVFTNLYWRWVFCTNNILALGQHTDTIWIRRHTSRFKRGCGSIKIVSASNICVMSSFLTFGRLDIPSVTVEISSKTSRVQGISTCLQYMNITHKHSPSRTILFELLFTILSPSSRRTIYGTDILASSYSTALGAGQAGLRPRHMSTTADSSCGAGLESSEYNCGLALRHLRWTGPTSLSVARLTWTMTSPTTLLICLSTLQLTSPESYCYV